MMFILSEAKDLSLHRQALAYGHVPLGVTKDSSSLRSSE